MIKNIVFDIGSVLISYRYIEMMTDIGYSLEDATRIGEEIFAGGLWDDFDAGLLQLDYVLEFYKEKFPKDAEGIEYMLKNPELMMKKREAVWDKMHRIKESGKYKFYILSNYSEVMLKAHTDGLPFWDDFDGGVISYEVKCLKPSPDIYKALFDKYNLNPSECIFLDDRIENVEGSKAVGMDAIQILSPEHMLKVLDQFI